ncbi:hemocyte protein-glutamine gamma-glutamyltransferase-like isoform X1 [Biomphalaria glabrata]|uniref:Hemocyte protein-glutamine gamma-glutamyltransferase-like isoform X1 n=1 Tax=Biomphalaria glabrata TaxID=6526 RepID=A0A9W3AZP9_BIOGL|nr:hemocyte protein-glutamine gamma-glutamyltransferase-like isoform X1 [Biomphalaria glabrata]XP_055892690.1 hemocyte protein-glutamine gamma-glutamyltransferase-like isoform X1 [Biomphalaria glabrata]XP_055892691.1 hemocyte protein-glutamine gamma-glutamyltransferase-like isoform X1 [Biomphalaria glabrata]
MPRFSNHPGRYGPLFTRQQPPSTLVFRNSSLPFYNYMTTAHYYIYGNESTEALVTPARPNVELKQEAANPDTDKVLTVVLVDFKIPSNTKTHKTDKFDIVKSKTNPKLVVRRGLSFLIDVTFSKDYDESKDDVRVVFDIGENPLVSKGTNVEFILSDEDRPKEWGAKIVSQKGKVLTLEIFTPPSCLVGKWKLKLDVVKKENNTVSIYRYEHKDVIYILFNPWCKDDSVYMSNDRLLKEYVLNETGFIYSGNKNSITPKPWNFGQFETCILDVALYLLDISELKWEVRGNPINVVRKISALVNSSDEGGVLAGNWSGDYRGGRSPLSWTGSAAILEEYWQTKCPVKFGQCWVFSGLSTTICRALGIPARSVTNYASAHDTDGSITIDVHFTSDGASNDALNYDSIWNFHVWNEAWMARPDLPNGYGGWQAFDATPQEASDYVYCCGPTSVAAVKQGEVNLPYDGPFVFAEVNADRIYWVPDSEGKLKSVYTDKRLIGKNISTKAANSDDREDITLTYKSEEGSAEERVAVLRANQVGSNRKDIYIQKSNDIEFSVDQDESATFVGGNFELRFRMKNGGVEVRTVTGRIEVKSMYYTGVVAEPVTSNPFGPVTINPGEEQSVFVVATQADYDGKLKDCCMLDVTIWAVVQETEQYFTKKDDFRLRKPHLAIKAPSEAVSGQQFTVDVSFTNPLNRDLTNCYVVVDGLAQSFKFPQTNVAANSTFMATLPIIPTKVGKTDLIISFNSDQLEDINVSHHILLKK